MVSPNENKKDESRNALLFYTAAFISFGLMVWFTLAFFREHWKMYDVSVGMLFIGLGIVASYAAHNKVVKRKCPELKNRPGEWIFVIVLAWASAMWTLYQIRLFSRLWGIELAVPEQFYSFVGSLAAIFGFSRIWDFVSPNNKKYDENFSISIVRHNGVIYSYFLFCRRWRGLFGV